MSDQGQPGWNQPPGNPPPYQGGPTPPASGYPPPQYGGSPPPAPAYGQPGPYPSGPPPQYGAPAAPARRRRMGGCLWIALAVVVLALLGIGGCSYWVYTLARGPIDGVNDWVALVDDGNYQGAYDELCGPLKATTDPAFVTAELERQFGAGITDFSFSSVSSTNGVTTVDGTIEVAGVNRPVEFVMREESGTWRVCSLPR